MEVSTEGEMARDGGGSAGAARRHGATVPKAGGSPDFGAAGPISFDLADRQLESDKKEFLSPACAGEKNLYSRQYVWSPCLHKHSGAKLQHWRGFQGIFGLEGAPMLEFGLSCEVNPPPVFGSPCAAQYLFDEDHRSCAFRAMTRTKALSCPYGFPECFT